MCDVNFFDFFRVALICCFGNMVSSVEAISTCRMGDGGGVVGIHGGIDRLLQYI